MNVIVKLSFLFSCGSVLGWCLELVFRKWFGAHNPEHKWINPGFLIGPWLPIYGFGLVCLYLMGQMPLPENMSGTEKKIVVFLLMAVAMTVIELIAGLIFIKGMKVRLWDYTNEKFNYKGIICPKFSFFWAVLGAGYYFCVHPYILDSLNWLGNNMAFCLVIGFFYGIVSVDMVYSFKLIARVKRFAKENDIIVKYEELKSLVRKISDENKEKVRFLFAIGNEHTLKDNMKNYAKWIEEVIAEKKEEFIEKQEELKEEISEKLGHNK